MAKKVECIQKNTDVCEKTYCLLQDATKNLNVLTTGDMFNTNIVCLSENKRCFRVGNQKQAEGYL